MTTHQQHQRAAAAELAARRALHRAEMSSAQAARLARRISAEADALADARRPRPQVERYASLAWLDRLTRQECNR
jgi:hypothetical protein